METKEPEAGVEAARVVGGLDVGLRAEEKQEGREVNSDSNR